MEEMRREARREAAIRKLERARERSGRARMRALVLPIGLFGVVWVAVFAQMATGNDPALSNTPKVAAKKAVSSDPRAAAASGGGTSAKPQPQTPATVLAYDPVTGAIVRTPAASAQTTATPTPAPAPAPVTTSQS
jgi:cytoskeletal protein RodZ